MSFLKALIDHNYNLEPIENAIKMTLSPDQNTSSAPLHIIIVNALGGGTGSGTFIPFALYARHYFKTLSSRKRVRIGFISTVSNTDKSDERQNENDAIEEIKSILMNKKQLLAKNMGTYLMILKDFLIMDVYTI
ncbi:MAG: hypothetical protein OMM_14937 [Candidatus Magnetoglobus multicellularis str. Araruama]|uniref:Uncharacterized protein n=1 Tax=Candidatus Magnetoglobus multicellularis str. Araruama TaxID=890399 RepID=A0A1V1NR34_9BACT|nr:MAG: hypothetical protein OMM_14937 [Candidatus Magnetoglobus multicellularis str. Araruama]